MKLRSSSGDSATRTPPRTPTVPSRRNTTTKCTYCEKTFTTLFNCKRHVREVHEPAATPAYDCEHCAMSFKRKEYLVEHLLAAHEEDTLAGEKIVRRKRAPVGEYRSVTRCTCEFCGKIYDNATNKDRHVMEKHLQVRPYGCRSCGIAFRRKPQLMRHLAAQHDNDESVGVFPGAKRSFSEDFKFACNFASCRHRFGTQAELDAHEATHQKVLGCTLCRVGFLTRDILLAHLRSEEHLKKLFGDDFAYATSVFTDDCTVICKICGLAFSKIDDALKHLYAEHKSANDAEHNCAECQQAYGDPIALNRHFLNEHLEPGAPVDYADEALEYDDTSDRPVCYICDKEFSSTRGLERHLATIHEGARQLICDACGENFNRTDQLQTHYRKKHKPKVIYVRTPKQEIEDDDEVAVEEEEMDEEQAAENIQQIVRQIVDTK
ncbi:zinc finger Y-chromosomal protein 2-like [Tubulanus polymorphus]|uniref:zinc finger Y-chromosomal protein 2-like n=1 Tax=Tubulanus polymorphus TaxID=672921 RepID=UPI003DA4B963